MPCIYMSLDECVIGFKGVIECPPESRQVIQIRMFQLRVGFIIELCIQCFLITSEYKYSDCCYQVSMAKCLKTISEKYMYISYTHVDTFR